MALSYAVGSFAWAASDTATTNISVSSLSFQPKAVRLWTVGRSEGTDTVARADTRFSCGVATSSTDRRCIGAFSVDANTQSQAHGTFRDDSVISIPNDTGIDGALDFVSFNSDGFTVVVDNQIAADIRICYEVWGGADLTNVACFTHTAPSGGAGSNSYTGASFQPDFAFFLSGGASFSVAGTALNNDVTNFAMCVGAASGSGEIGTVSAMVGDNQGNSDTYSYAISAECITVPASSGSIVCRASFTSFNSNGFTLNWAESPASVEHYVAGLLMKGGQYFVGDVTTQTSTGTWAETGVGFQPVGLSLHSVNEAAHTADTSSAEAKISIGATDGTNSVAQATYDEDGRPNMEIQTAIDHDKVYVNVGNNAAIDGLAAYSSFDSDGFTLDMTDADPSAAYVWYAAYGSDAAAGVGVPLVMHHRKLMAGN